MKRTTLEEEAQGSTEDISQMGRIIAILIQNSVYFILL